MREALLAAALLAGCGVPGTCDDIAARRVATRADGFPAFEGQAMIIRSCGYGSHCHSEGIPAEERNGAPAGLELDIRLASQGPEAGEVERLERNRQRVFEMRGELWHQIAAGRMPPAGRPAELVARSAPVFFGDDGAPLPEITSDEGREIVRNWMACLTPVIERTQSRADGMPNLTGDTVSRSCSAMEECTFALSPRCDLATNVCVPCESSADCAHLGSASLCDVGECVEPALPTFASIHELVILRRCATPACHSAERHAGRLDMESRGDAHRNLIGVPADGSIFCRTTSVARVVPGEPDASLFYLKLTGGDVCGEHMPLGQQAIPEQHAMAIREWIANGAAED